MDLINRDDNLSLEINGQGYPERPALGGGLRQIVSVLFKWKWMIVAVVCAITVPVVLFNSEAPTRYRARAKLMVKRERAYLAVSASDLKRVHNFRQSTQEVVNSEMQIIRSQEVIKQALEALQLPPSVERVQRSLSLTPVRDSNVINLSFTSTNPDEPIPLLNKLLDVYLDKHAQIHNPQGVVAFLERQVEFYRQKSEEGARHVHEFEEQHGISNAEAEIAATLQSLASLQASQNSVELEIKQLRQRVTFLSEELGKQPEKIDYEDAASVPNPIYDRLNRQLLDFEQQKAALLERHRLKHPRVLAKQREIEETEARIAALEPWQNRSVARFNPIRLTMQQQLMESQGRLAGAEEQQEALSNLIERTRADLLELNVRKFEYQRLSAEMTTRQNKFALYQG